MGVGCDFLICFDQIVNEQNEIKFAHEIEQTDSDCINCLLILFIGNVILSEGDEVIVMFIIIIIYIVMTLYPMNES